MSIHKQMSLQKFEDFKKHFSQTIDLVGDAVDSFQVIVKKNGFNIEEKIHAKTMTRVKKVILELLMKHFDSFKEDLRIYHKEAIEEFEIRVRQSLEKVDRDLLDLDKY